MRTDTGREPHIGVVGLGMGLHLAAWCERLGLRVVAACDLDPTRRTKAAVELPNAQLTARWQDLLVLDLDAVILAGDFDSHAPLAVAFLQHDISVLSEAAACTSEDEGRRLLRAAELSAATYSFAENYVAHPHVHLIRQAVEAGEIGRVTMVEADYLHGMAPEQVAQLIHDPTHWRGRIPPTAYCTHTLSPIIAVTGARPTEVTAFTVDQADPRAAVTLAVRLSDGTLALSRHGFLQGEPESHWSWLSVRGDRGLAESVRAAGDRAWSVRVRQEAWAAPAGAVRDEERQPPPLLLAGQPVERHAEGTVRLLTAFRETLTSGTPPMVSVRQAISASLVGVAGARSLAEGSRPVSVPLL